MRRYLKKGGQKPTDQSGRPVADGSTIERVSTSTSPPKSSTATGHHTSFVIPTVTTTAPSTSNSAAEHSSSSWGGFRPSFRRKNRKSSPVNPVGNASCSSVQVTSGGTSGSSNESPGQSSPPSPTSKCPSIASALWKPLWPPGWHPRGFSPKRSSPQPHHHSRFPSFRGSKDHKHPVEVVSSVPVVEGQGGYDPTTGRKRSIQPPVITMSGPTDDAPEASGVHNRGSLSMTLTAGTVHRDPVSTPIEDHNTMESWLDEHPAFVQQYFVRKGSRTVVDAWLKARAGHSMGGSGSASAPASGATTPVRKISAHEFERGSLLLGPMICTTSNGTPTFLPDEGTLAEMAAKCPPRKSRQELQALDEKQLIFELVKDICNDLDVKSLCHKILQNVSIITNADRCSLFLVKGEPNDLDRHFVSTLFDVSPDSTIEEMDKREEIKVPWGQGIVGFVASAGHAIHIPDCYQDERFSDVVDKQTGYTTRNMLCAPIHDIHGEVVAVAQVINKKFKSKESDPVKIDEEEEEENGEESAVAVRTSSNGTTTNTTTSPIKFPPTSSPRKIPRNSSSPKMPSPMSPTFPSPKSCSSPSTSRPHTRTPSADEADGSFDDRDMQVFTHYLQFCGIGLRNAQLFERSQLENKRNQVLLDLARMVFEEQSTLEHIVYRIMVHIQSLLEVERCQILLIADDSDYNPDSRKTFCRVFDFEHSDPVNPPGEEGGSDDRLDSFHEGPHEGRFPINVGITGFVATTGLILNIPDAYNDHRFDQHVDDSTFRHKSILCMPIKNASGKIIGVSQLVNKINGSPFTKNDENLFEAFSIFCGMGIQNVMMYEKLFKSMAKQKVTFEILSYHATAPFEEAQLLSKQVIPSTQALKLHDFEFCDFSLDEDLMVRATIRMFMDLDLIERFHMDYGILCRWLLSVRKNYRPVLYHNWRHAFNVAQMMFSILTATGLVRTLGEIETLSLLVACLCHDLDHRGTNNSFQVKTSSPLAQLYSTSVMERHHFDQCLMILNSEGNQIFGSLSPEEYRKAIHVLEEAILATDIAIYFKNRPLFFKLVDSREYALIFGDGSGCDERKLLRGMLMTACDIAAITKPWEIQRIVAKLVASEFFEQGDIEKKELNLEPIDMMNREKEDELPKMQVSFIDSVCAPIYESFAKLFPHQLVPLQEGVAANRAHWIKIAQEKENLKDWAEEQSIVLLLQGEQELENQPSTSGTQQHRPAPTSGDHDVSTDDQDDQDDVPTDTAVEAKEDEPRDEGNSKEENPIPGTVSSGEGDGDKKEEETT